MTTQAAGLIGVNHGGFLFGGVTESAAAVTFQNGVINSSHIRQRYDCYAMLEPEASGGAADYAYPVGARADLSTGSLERSMARLRELWTLPA